MKLQKDIILPSLTLQNGILRLFNEASKVCNVEIHILLALDINLHHLEINTYSI